MNNVYVTKANYSQVLTVSIEMVEELRLVHAIPVIDRIAHHHKYIEQDGQNEDQILDEVEMAVDDIQKTGAFEQ